MAPSCLRRPGDHQQPQRTDPGHRDNPVPDDDVPFCRCSPPASGRSHATKMGGSLALAEAPARGMGARARLLEKRTNGASRTCSALSRFFPRTDHRSRVGRVSLCAQLLVEGIPQSVAEQVEGEHRDQDRHPRKNRDVVGNPKIAAAVRQHRAPLGARWLGAETDER
jgi:hypothetical protein